MFYKIKLALLVFLWVWLKQVYKDDLEVLTKELTFFYANTARDIEDESFHKLILGPVSYTHLRAHET